MDDGNLQLEYIYIDIQYIYIYMYIIFITSYITQTGNIPDTTWLPPMVLSSHKIHTRVTPKSHPKSHREGPLWTEKDRAKDQDGRP